MILGPDGQPIRLAPAERREPAHRGNLSAAYDDVFRMPELADHFAGANAMSVRAALSSSVRKHIREKIRHERTQNSYLAGMLQTGANYLIGTGPKLQMLMPGMHGRPDRMVNREIEQDWVRWSKRVRLAEKLRTMVIAKKGDGESFGVMAYNPVIGDDTGVPLDLVPLEADQVEYLGIDFALDLHGSGGIVYDEYDNPVKYPVLQAHPGDSQWFVTNMSEPQWVERKYMIHLFRRDRPGQRRGVSEWLPAMPLFALYRRMTLATIGNIETAANISSVLETEADVDEQGNARSPYDSENDWFMSFPIARRMMMTLPAGAKMKQYASGQPNSQYDSFTRSLIREIARCTSMPFNIAAGDSSDYNYSSGRLDHQSFFLSNGVELQDIECEAVERIFERWIRIRASRKTGIAPEDIDVSGYSHQWVWDGLEHVDPAKEANAAATRLSNGITTRGIEYFKQGRDIDDVDERAAEELGFNSVQEYRRAIAASVFGIHQRSSSAGTDGDPTDDNSGRSPRGRQPGRETMAAMESLVEDLLASNS